MAKQTITTKYHGPSNIRGARISATSTSGIRVYVERNHANRIEDDHKLAAMALIGRLDWHRLGGAWVPGA